MAVVRLTTGKQGDGKSWSICRRIVKEWLPDFENGVLWTNLPLRLDDWTDEGGTRRKGLVAYVAEQTGKTEEAIAARIRIIPDEEIAEWRNGTSDPASYFDRIHEEEGGEHHPLRRSHVIIDEAGKIWPAGGGKTREEREAVKKLCELLATIRHDGATIEFVCQDSGQLPREVVRLCGEHLVMNNTAEEPEPFFKMKKGEWYQFLACFMRVYFTYIRCTRKVPEGEKLVTVDSVIYWLDPFYFLFYDSFNRPGAASGTRKKLHWERQSIPVFLFFWYFRNFYGLTTRAMMAAAVVWCCFLGGAVMIFQWFQGELNGIATEQMERAAAKRGEVIDKTKTGAPKVAAPAAQAARLKEAQAIAADPAKVAFLMEQIERFREDRDDARRQLEAIAKQAEDAAAVALIDEDGMALRSGEYYRVGDQILWGKYEGRHVSKVDRRHGMVVLSDGSVLRMRTVEPSTVAQAPAGPRMESDRGGRPGDRGTPPIERRFGEPTPAARPDRVAERGESAGGGLGALDDPTRSVLDRSGEATR